MKLEPLGLKESGAIYGAGAVLLYIATRTVIPWLVERFGLEPIVAWFVAAGLTVFVPLIAIGIFLLAREPRSRASRWLARRLWLRPMLRDDWLWTLAGAGAIALLSAPVTAALVSRYGKAAFTPEFLAYSPLGPRRFWILTAWLPFFLVNMLGEAFIWHSVMLPRQERSVGKWAWLVSGCGWALFHMALPWQILVSLVPTIFVIPYLVQRRSNVWVGVVLHVFVNGPGFIAVALGLV
ncbi:MAG TPA: CPBP family intramembrane glutamic endopeptidase [Woeseiaceae bacterium]|nr:CPBP family intramembrane glutamic endopeptidase [Woeseiaceae bacterium]